MNHGLREKIGEALAAHVDPALFEQCSWDLLLPVYPGLAPIPGGYDFGRDADIHTASDSARLLATTAADVARNLTKSLDRLAAAGLGPSHVVLATTQQLSERRRRTLREAANRLGVRRLDIFDRQSWIGRLYHDPAWRQRLLGLSGQPTAVVDVPLQLELSGGMDLPLVGRDDEVRSLLAEPTDWIVAGVAGSGKTRLVAELPNVGFVISNSSESIADDLRAGDYAYIVVDDADTSPGVLRSLAELRRTEGLGFQLVGTTWPQHVGALADELVHSHKLNLQLLERTDIDAIVTAVGVQNYYVRSEILEQAEGRAGWAYALAVMARDGDVTSLTTGRGLMDEVERFLRRSGLASALGLVAHLALLGSLDPADMGRLAAYLQIPRLSVDEQMGMLTRAGLVESVRGRVAVRPEALRRALVAHWFFGPDPFRTPEEFLASWGKHTDAIIASIIQAADLGAESARLLVLALIRDGLLAEHHLRSAAALDEAMARTIVANSKPHEQMRDVYEVAARRYAMPEAVMALLDLAIGDDRPRHSHPDHPLRIVSEIGTRLYPHAVTSFDARLRILRAGVRWARERSSEQSWAAFAEVATNVLGPEVEGSWPELGSLNRFTMAAGFESPANLRAIERDYWPVVAPLLIDMPDAAVSELVSLLEAWLRVARGYAGRFGTTPNQAAIRLAKRLTRTMKREFGLRSAGRPGLTVRLRNVGRLLRSPIHVPGLVNDEFLSLSRDDLHRQDWKKAERERAKELSALARAWARETPSEVVGRLVAWRTEARIAHVDVDAAIAATLDRAIEIGDRAEMWAGAVIEANLCPAGTTAIRAALVDVAATPSWVAEAMKGPCRTAVLDAVLVEPPTVVTLPVLQQLDELDASVVEWAVKRREFADETCRMLLRHKNSIVRGAAALGFGVGGRGHGPAVPTDWREDWSSALSSIDFGLHGAFREYEVREVLENLVSTDPAIAEAWVASALAKAKHTVSALPYDADEYLHKLPREHRDRLLRRTPAGWNRSQLLAVLLGDDAQWAEGLIADRTVSAKDLLHSLVGRTGPTFEPFLSLLLSHGVSPAEVASGAHLNRVWVGEESSQYAELRDYFASLVNSPNEAVAAVGEAGTAYYNRLFEVTVEQERSERIRGRW